MGFSGAPDDGDQASDRAIFWAELGLVSSPTLLARLGRLLRERADTTGDAELACALKLAERHVSQTCSVWSRYASAHGSGAESAYGAGYQGPASGGGHFDRKLYYRSRNRDHPTRGDSCSSTMDLCTSDKSARAPESLLLAVHHEQPGADSPGNSDESADEESNPDEEQGLLGADRRWVTWCGSAGLGNLLEPAPWMCFLPCIGSLLAQVMWTLMAAFSVFILVSGAVSSDHSRTGLSLTGVMVLRNGPVCFWGPVVNLLTSVPLMWTLRDSVTSDAWRRGVNIVLSSRHGNSLRRFMLHAAAIAGVPATLMLPGFIFARSFGWLEVFARITAWCLRWFAIYILMMVWRLSTLTIAPLRDGVRECDINRLDWATVTRSYQADWMLIDSLWARSGLALVLTIHLTLWLLYAVWEIIVIVADGYPHWRIASIAMQTTCYCVCLLALGGVAAIRSSTSKMVESLLSIAALRQVPPEQMIGRMAFIHVLRSLRSGIELPLMGRITGRHGFFLVRMICACVVLGIGSVNNIRAHEGVVKF